MGLLYTLRAVRSLACHSRKSPARFMSNVELFNDSMEVASKGLIHGNAYSRSLMTKKKGYNGDWQTLTVLRLCYGWCRLRKTVTVRADSM